MHEFGLSHGDAEASELLQPGIVYPDICKERWDSETFGIAKE